MTDQSFSASTATQDDKIVAALAHALGPLIAIIVWATQKDKSPFVAFQSLQALVYQLTGFVGALLGMACYLCSFLGVFGGMFALTAAGAAATEGNLGAAEGFATLIGFLISMVTMIVPFAIFGLMFLAALAFFLYGLWAAISVFQGKDFRYIVIGRWLERYLAQDAGAKEAGT